MVSRGHWAAHFHNLLSTIRDSFSKHKLVVKYPLKTVQWCPTDLTPHHLTAQHLTAQHLTAQHNITTLKMGLGLGVVSPRRTRLLHFTHLALFLWALLPFFSALLWLLSSLCCSPPPPPPPALKSVLFYSKPCSPQDAGFIVVLHPKLPCPPWMLPSPCDHLV